MSLPESFNKELNNGNVRGVRIMMRDSILYDTTFAEFAEMDEAAKSMTELYDKHDGEEFIEDKSQWTEGYLDNLSVETIYNFSHERIEHLKEVVRYLSGGEKSDEDSEYPMTNFLKSMRSVAEAMASGYNTMFLDKVMTEKEEDTVKPAEKSDKTASGEETFGLVKRLNESIKAMSEKIYKNSDEE